MFTRCKGCHTVHPVNAALLARGGGKFRCSKCNKTGNALEALFDEWPGAGEEPPAAGDLPVLGLALDIDEAAQARVDPDLSDPTGKDVRSTGRRGKLLARFTWVTVILVTLLFSVYYLAGFYGTPILEQPPLQPVLQGLGLKPEPANEPFRDLSQIHLVSRELRSHPVEPGQLRLTATIVNRAAEPQPYPELEVILLDARGQSLASERFSPSDYLNPGSGRGQGMTPRAYLPLTLDLADPGEQAVGFELNFH